MNKEQNGKIASHRHGQGKRAREAWGSRQACAECSRLDAAMNQARADLKARQERAGVRA